MELLTTQIMKHVDFRLARPADAPFILSLRLDRERARYLSPVEDDLQAQQAWISDYVEREALGEEYYFIIQVRGGDDVGALRMYDFEDDAFTWGSWILTPGAPSYCALESALLVYEIAYNQRGFRRCHFQVDRANQRTIAFHSKLGAQKTGQDEVNCFFSFDRAVYLSARARYARFLAAPGPKVH